MKEQAQQRAEKVAATILKKRPQDEGYIFYPEFSICFKNSYF